MQVKRFCGLLLGVLLVLGISSSATGQDEITQGITIRVDEPDSGKVVGIGGSIVVRVINTLSPYPAEVVIRIVDANALNGGKCKLIETVDVIAT